MKLPASFEPFVFGLLLSGLMSFIITGIATWNALGFITTFAAQWMQSWLFAWAVAFPTVLVMAPLARRATRSLVARTAPH